LPAILPDPLSRRFAGLNSPNEAIKKGSFRSLVSRMGAFAGWLRHPAHARSYHNDDCDLCHDALVSPQIGRVNGFILKIAPILSENTRPATPH